MSGEDDTIAQSETEVIFEMLDAYQVSAAVGAAMELGLFWHLQSGSATGEAIAHHFGLPVARCRYWLQFLCQIGLISQQDDHFSLTTRAQTAILGSHSQATWALLAEESREHSPPFQYFSTHLQYQGSLWDKCAGDPPKYVDRMNEDPERARRFTLMLYELHQGLGERIADQLDMSHVERLMDLGGGSGVMSLELLRKYPELSAVVVDIPNGCMAGSEIASTTSVRRRIEFFPADFLLDPLPQGFDLVLECDVGVYRADLFKKIRSSLRPNGRFVIIDQLAEVRGQAPPARLSWALQDSLQDPDYIYPTVESVLADLESAGFQILRSEPLQPIDSPMSQITTNMVMIDAQI
jgi:SAM-dependent methyltransferase